MLRELRLARWLGGLERMYRWHYRTGVVAYVLLLVHPLTLATDGWRPRSAGASPMGAPCAGIWGWLRGRTGGTSPPPAPGRLTLLSARTNFTKPGRALQPWSSARAGAQAYRFRCRHR
jgi:hypothetical protein